MTAWLLFRNCLLVRKVSMVITSSTRATMESRSIQTIVNTEGLIGGPAGTYSTPTIPQHLLSSSISLFPISFHTLNPLTSSSPTVNWSIRFGGRARHEVSSLNVEVTQTSLMEEMYSLSLLFNEDIFMKMSEKIRGSLQ